MWRPGGGGGLHDPRSPPVSGGGTTTPPPPTATALVSAASGRCLDVPQSNTANGTQPVIWDCNNAANQRWTTSGQTLQALGKQIAMHVAASPTVQYVTEDEVPADVKEAELRVYEQQAADKPENVRPKIAEGKWRKKLEELVLLSQAHVNADKYEGKTIEQMRSELSGQLGENVVIRRFARFAVGS